MVQTVNVLISAAIEIYIYLQLHCAWWHFIIVIVSVAFREGWRGREQKVLFQRKQICNCKIAFPVLQFE